VLQHDRSQIDSQELAMTERFFRTLTLIFLSVTVAAVFLLSPVFCFAQENSENGQPKVDAEGCDDLAALSKLPGSIIESCQRGDDSSVPMPLEPDARGSPREKVARGSYEFRSYEIWQTDQQDGAFDNLAQLLAIGGFRIKYSAKPDTITARKEDVWVLVHVRGASYDVTVVNAEERLRTPPSDADAISRDMETLCRAAIYGIRFSDDNSAVVEEKSTILFEVLAYLKSHPDVAVTVESHISTEEGSPQGDEEITRRRAKAVVAWLEDHGVSGKRLEPRGLGRAKPVTENDTPSEIRQNERIELAKMKC
jgi:outer membrane protein OmpA-like peptidoglycan-associated protein